MEHQAPSKSVRKPILIAVVFVLAILVAALVLLTSFFHCYRAIGASMLPSIAENDIMICQKTKAPPQPGDIVVFQVPSYIPETIVKRVIATEGQHVVIDYGNNCVLVDGVPLDEPYVPEPMKDPGPTGPTFSINDITVPSGCVFVLGDNRNHSSDSRNERLGCVPVSAIQGKVIRILHQTQKK